MKKIYLVIIVFLVSLKGFGQWEEESKFYVGGNVGLNFGTYTSLYIAPEGFYSVIPRLQVGLGGAYSYFYDNYNKLGSSTYGGKFALRVIITDFLYAQAEYEGIKYINSYFQSQPNQLFDETRLLLGGGYRQWIGDYSFTYINLFWNPDATGFTYFSGINPIIKVGINIGIN